jgi:hypothetical protein
MAKVISTTRTLSNTSDFAEQVTILADLTEACDNLKQAAQAVKQKSAAQAGAPVSASPGIAIVKCHYYEEGRLMVSGLSDLWHLCGVAKPSARAPAANARSSAQDDSGDAYENVDDAGNVRLQSAPGVGASKPSAAQASLRDTHDYQNVDEEGNVRTGSAPVSTKTKSATLGVHHYYPITTRCLITVSMFSVNFEPAWYTLRLAKKSMTTVDSSDILAALAVKLEACREHRPSQ